MRIKTYRFWLYSVTGFFLLLILLLWMLNIVAPKPPSIDVAKAREAIAETRIALAHDYLPLEYSRIQRLYDSIMKEWQRQNERFFLKRDFSEIKELAESIIEVSENLKKDSERIMINMEESLTNDLGKFNIRIVKYDSIINIISLPKSQTEKYTRGKLYYLESRKAYEDKNFNAAYRKLQSASQLCNEVIDSTNLRLRDYFDNYINWTKIVDKAIAHSVSKKEYVIIVDKFAKTCTVYYRGRIKNVFRIELGPNWIGDKRHKGDNATPEGQYMVTKKLSGRNTKYYKALLLNYPNEQDQKRFIEAIKNGSLPKTSDIGGLIEIHGGGGRGFHWTNGCIALNNPNMDVVFKLSSVGTQVIIVGSRKKLSELFNLE